MKQQAMADRAFLALTIWREARGESRTGKAGVAHAVLNRVAKPGWWGKDVASCLFKKWQFSSLTDPRDPQLISWPLPTDRSWQECLEIACEALDGVLPNPVPGADSYYDLSIKPPAWAVPQALVAQVGRLRFYNLDGDRAVNQQQEESR